MNRWVSVGLACGVAVAACGGSSSTIGGGSAQVTGTVGGTSLEAGDTIGLTLTETNNGVTESAVEVIITNIAGACSVVQRGGNPKNTQALVLIAVAAGSSVPAGSYDVGATVAPGGSASFEAQDENCNETNDETGASGTITVTSSSSSSVDGSFDVTFEGGDHLSGNFTAPVCNASLTNDGGVPACGS